MASKKNEAPANPASITLMSIGELARRTGVSPDTLRVWERRYGEPVPVRLPSGHRRYTEAHVARLRRVAEALAHGLRPSQVLGESEEVLETLMEPFQVGEDRDPILETMLGFVADYDRDGLKKELLALWQQHPAERWLHSFVGPLVAAVGHAWAEGRLDVRQEHFMSEVLEDMLRTLRVDIETEQMELAGQPILLTTLPEERHRIGLLMVALLCSIHQVPVRMLGTDTPMSEIRGAVRDIDARAVAVSVSLASGGPQTDRLLRQLREEMPDEVDVLVGGAGARGHPARASRHHLSGEARGLRALAREEPRRLRGTVC
jgi:DNA-binding transcriptional MerR regulator